MKKLYSTLFAIALFLAFSYSAPAAGSTPVAPLPNFDGARLVAGLRANLPVALPGDSAKAYDLSQLSMAAGLTLDNYTARFEKEEFLDGKQRPLEEINVRVREQPFAVNMKWVGPEKKGHEALYVAGQNGNKLRTYVTWLIFPLTLNLDPEGSLARGQSCHPITKMGLQTLSRGTLKYTGEPEPAPAESFRYLGLHNIDGRPCDVVGRRMFFAAGQASDDYLIYGLDTVTHLPRVAMHFAADGRQLEYYHYKNINLNAGLVDKDFDFARLGK